MRHSKPAINNRKSCTQPLLFCSILFLRLISNGSLWGWKEFGICCFGELFVSEESANTELLFPLCVGVYVHAHAHLYADSHGCSCIWRSREQSSLEPVLPDYTLPYKYQIRRAVGRAAPKAELRLDCHSVNRSLIKGVYVDIIR